MKTLGEYLKELRGKESLRDASSRIGISHTYLDTIEKGYDKRSGKIVNPTPETLKLISKAYMCEYEDLMTRAGYLENENKKTQMSKDELDIAKRMAELREDLSSATGLLFDGEPMSDEAKESLLEAMEFGVRLAKKNNKKYIPKKYQNDEE
ncbi:helix-turn-helix domain-containing protein [Lysinibacillus sp. JNUCC-52]|uniref:helix-turn-helix domain-containing protein n=1 Tax=Lysinibacillus sp. JNUCC-52 TaxID=2792480 RepID=UPI0019380FA5|nr:helix-turn-helix domain-containing protein [Lysinibacillus sp. JNUCC-52]